MTVSFDALSKNVAGFGAGTSFSWTHTPAGTPTAVAVFLNNYQGNTNIVGVTYGGLSMSLAVLQVDGNLGTPQTEVAIFGLANPPAGPQTVVVTLSATGYACLGYAVTVTGSDTTTAFRTTASTNGNSATSSSQNISSANGDLVVDIFGGQITSPAPTGGSQTLLFGPDTAFLTAAGSSAPATGVTTLQWSTSASTVWATAAVSFKLGLAPPNPPVGILGMASAEW